MQDKETIFRIYFDTDNSELTPAEAIRTIRLLEIARLDFQKNILNKKSKIKIKIKPSKHGSYDFIVGIICGVGINITTDCVKAFLQGLGLNPVDALENLGLFIKDFFKIFLSTPQKELEPLLATAQINNLNFDNTLTERSALFKELDLNTDIKGIGFGTDCDLITPPNYYKYITEDLIRPLPDEHYYQKVKIWRPVVAESKEKAKWGFIDSSSKKPIYTNISDYSFLDKVQSGTCSIKSSPSDDYIQCKIKYEKEIKNGKERISNITILEVYTFNAKTLKPLPGDFQVNSPTVKNSNLQATLFD